MAKIAWAVALVFLVAAPGAAQAPTTWAWSVPGSTGVTDDEGTWAVALHDTGSAAIRTSVQSATIKLRYAITGGPDHLDGFDPAWFMRLAVRDTGPTARVVVKVIALNAATGAQSTLGTFDSDSDPRVVPGAEYQSLVVGPLLNPQLNGSFQGFDHGRFAYYAEVTLTKTDATGNPGVRFVSVFGG